MSSFAETDPFLSLSDTRNDIGKGSDNVHLLPWQPVTERSLMKRRYQRTLLNRGICDAHVAAKRQHAWGKRAMRRIFYEWRREASLPLKRHKHSWKSSCTASALKIKFNSFFVSPWHECLMTFRNKKNFRLPFLSFVSSSSSSSQLFWSLLSSAFPWYVVKTKIDAMRRCSEGAYELILLAFFWVPNNKI